MRGERSFARLPRPSQVDDAEFAEQRMEQALDVSFVGDYIHWLTNPAPACKMPGITQKQVPRHGV